MDLQVAVTILHESFPEKLQLIMQVIMIKQGTGPVHQREKHSLFVGRVVVGVGMETEVGMCGLAVLYGPVSYHACAIYQRQGRVGGG
jgi:hypothetical protein